MSGDGAVSVKGGFRQNYPTDTAPGHTAKKDKPAVAQPWAAPPKPADLPDGPTSVKVKAMGELLSDLLSPSCRCCNQPYSGARFLSCHHLFCHPCLEPMVSGNSVKCPACQFQTVLPVKDGILGGLDALGIDPFMARLLKLLRGDQSTCENCNVANGTLWCRQCDSPICHECYEATHQFRLYTTFRHHSVVPLDTMKLSKDPLCEIHEDEKLLFLCLEDQEFLCKDCVLSPAHADHKHVPIKDAARQTREEIRYLIDQVRNRLEQVQAQLNLMRAAIPAIDEEYDIVLRRINARAEELQKALSTRREASFKEARDLKNTKVDRLRAQDHLMAKTAYGTNLCAIVNERILELGSDFEVLKFFKEMETHLMGVLEAECPIEPVEDASLSASVEDLGKGLENAITTFKRMHHSSTETTVIDSTTTTTTRTQITTSGAASSTPKLYAIGGWDGAVNLQTVEVYDPTTNAWENIAPMTCKRRGLAAAALNGLIYVVGGWDGEHYLDSVEVYDPRVGKWQIECKMTYARCYGAATAMDGKLYVVGGYYGNRNLDTVECYDPRTQTWTPCARMATPRRGVGLVVSEESVQVWDGQQTVDKVERYLYAVGGWNGTHNLDTVERYDPEANEWTVVERMSSARSSVSTANLGGKLYAIGGWDGSRYLNTVERYQSKTNEWAPAASMTCARSYGAVATMLGKVYALGGWDGQGSRRLDTVEYYDPRYDQWFPCEKMNQARYGVAAVAL
eukprot:JP435665.1.p1 GENE.JP435665.1~~JP435665.1.p1  ORF type:complete len:737 (+),score=221.44 JP435665.1:53-2263(+)